MAQVETEFLVAGAGPAGAALACFLAQNGLKGITIASAPGTTETPRAHVVNPFTVECFRELGLEDQCMREGAHGDALHSFRWCRSMVGEEFGRVRCWGVHPKIKGDMERATPCSFIDLPQSYMEPILVRYASHHGFEMRFSTTLKGVERTETGWLSTVEDSVTKQTYKIASKFLFGADGGRSAVARSLDFKLHAEPSGGVACNVLFKADLTHLMRQRESQLHFIMNPELRSRFGVGVCFRMIRPWHEWLMMAVHPGLHENVWSDLTTDDPELIKFIQALIGDDSVPVEVTKIDPWVLRETVAETYHHDGNVFILGDAAHRHSPSFGLGSNTCVQDAYNLAWKVAYVTKGLAGAGLLETYSAERQPVGVQIVKAATEGVGAHFAVWEALGMLTPTAEEGKAQLEEASAATEGGVARRKRLRQALLGKDVEGQSLGINMNQWYDSQAIYLADEPKPRPPLEGDFVTNVQITTYPGTRLPHAWLDTAIRGKTVSTQDIVGNGKFAVLTGHGGDAWKTAAASISEATGIPIVAHSIGLGLDYHDVYCDWEDNREVEEDGVVLVRPDRVVAWRSPSLVADPQAKLREVLDAILFRSELTVTN